MPQGPWQNGNIETYRNNSTHRCQFGTARISVAKEWSSVTEKPRFVMNLLPLPPRTAELALWGCGDGMCDAKRCKGLNMFDGFRKISKGMQAIEAITLCADWQDLGRYHSALDKALMKFHSLKMAEINKTIKELWQRASCLQ